MMLTPTIASGPVLGFLANFALRAVILAAIAGLGLTLFRVKSASLRLSTWTAVLCGSLALPVLAWLLPAMQVPLPSLLRRETLVATPKGFSAQTRALVTIARKPAASAATSIPDARKDAVENPATRVPVEQSIQIRWDVLTDGFYLGVTLLLLARLVAGWYFTVRLISRSKMIDSRALTTAIPCSISATLNDVQILQSDLVRVPLTVGFVRPRVILPGEWKEWDATSLAAVLTHELSHVERHDALTQLAARLYRAIFWFSPVAWWLDRQLRILAEQASDEAVLSGGVDRTQYARTLLGFFEQLHASPARVWWEGVSMAKAGEAERRLEQILRWRGVIHMSAKKTMLAVIAAVAIPVLYLAAAARPSDRTAVVAQSAPAATPPGVAAPASVPPAPAIAPAAPAAPVGAVGSGVSVAPALPAAPVAAGIPTAMAWAPGDSGSSSHGKRGYAYAYGFDDEQRFVIVSGNSDSVTMSGSSEEMRHVQKLKKVIPGDFIWFQRDEKSYIIRDQATVDRARKLWAPQEELGKKQEELGKQQEALGAKQEALGKKMEEVRVNVPDMTAELDRLKAKLQKLGSQATVEQIGDLQSEIGELQSKIGEIQSHAGDQQGKLGEEMGALGEEQGKLGEQQGKLGEEQGRLAEKASQEMKSLLDEALKNGKALREPESGADGGTI